MTFDPEEPAWDGWPILGGWAKRGGIERVLTLECGRTFSVDEKVRTSEWPDIQLERWSDEERQTPG